MAQQLTTQTSTVPAQRNSFPTIDVFFDALEHIIERMEGLVWKSKVLIFSVGFLLFLVYELAHYARFLLVNWKGG